MKINLIKKRIKEITFLARKKKGGEKSKKIRCMYLKHFILKSITSIFFLKSILPDLKLQQVDISII